MQRTNAGGGIADKLGNRYELAWAVHYALRCIQDERRSLTLEDLDPDLSEGSEFTFVDEYDVIVVTQVKRQHSINDHWTISALRSRKVFAAAARHVAAGREYHFNSTTPCGQLRVLCEWARQSASVEQFVSRQLTKELSPAFDELSSSEIFGSAENAWRVLRGMWFEVGDEAQLVRTNAMLATTILEGTTEALLAITVGAVLHQNLRRRLTRRELLEELGKYSVVARTETARRTAHREVSAATESWRKTIERELLSPQIPRVEASELVDLMSSTRLALVVGTAGGGKSSVAFQAARELATRGTEVLAFRLDRRGVFTSTTELGGQLGLSDSPVASLRMAADGRDAILLVDQLDAVSLASGRLSDRYDVIADLIDEAVAMDGVRVILVCRLFDVENDHRIRKLDARKDVSRLNVSPLTDAEVSSAIHAMGLSADELTSLQRDLLRSPLNLVLLESVANQPTALTFTSRGSLFEAFWRRKRQSVRDSHPEVRFNEVLARVANAASDQQHLTIDVETLDAGDYINDAHVLASEQVLAIEGNRVSFFHEAFFDYAFARQWLSRQESMVEFLTAREQELFRRAQVRQILELLRERDGSRSRAEVESVLTHPDIRVHIKETVRNVLANVAEPVDADLDLVLRLTTSPSHHHLWHQVARPSWFGLVYDRGLVDAWLDSPETALRERGAAFLFNAGHNHSATVVKILTERADDPDYAKWLNQVIQRTDLHKDRPLFELLINAVKHGDFGPATENLWFSTHNLASERPVWAVELLGAYFGESPSAFATDERGKISLLKTREYGLLELIQVASTAEPRVFAQTVVPYLLDVMHAAPMESSRPGLVLDQHFSFRVAGRNEPHDVDDALYECASQSLGRWTAEDPLSVEPLLLTLSASEYDAAQALLFKALIAGADQFANWAAELLLEGGTRLESGYLSDSRWLSRELIAAIAPLVPDDVHRRLESMVRDFRNPYERGPSFGFTAFQFLSALDLRRLTPTGAKRLAEYQRKFGVESPAEPTGIVSYTVVSPIDAAAAGRMSDKQWLRALAKHNLEDRDRSGSRRDPWVGGARELSHTLKERTSEDPLRFAGLAMRMTASTNPAYSSAVLWGFGEATIPSDALATVFEAIRHIMSLGFAESDRWLGWSLRRALDDAPIDLVELVIDRALNSPNPRDNSPVVTRSDGTRPARDLRQDGINTARGSLAEELGDLLVHDSQGERTAAVAPHLVTLANDPVLSVRACVAHTIAACLRHARATAYLAFDELILADDILLASDLVRSLMIYIGNANPELIDPVIDRMLQSSDEEVRQAGGSMAAFAALQWDRRDLMQRALQGDVSVRVGVAVVCSARIDRAADSKLNFDALHLLMHDERDEVRKAVGGLVGHLRGRELRPFVDILAKLIESPSYLHANPQLFLVLQDATDKVDDLTDLAARRFLDLHASEMGDLRTAAAGDAHYISELVIRGLAQTDDKSRVSALLDIVDQLLQLGVYGVERTLETANRD